MTPIALAEWPERRTDFGGEQLGLFPGGEVAALVDLVQVGEGGVDLLCPAPPLQHDVVDDSVRGEMARGLLAEKAREIL